MGPRDALGLPKSILGEKWYLITAYKPLIPQRNRTAAYCAWGCFRVFLKGRQRSPTPPHPRARWPLPLQQRQQRQSNDQNHKASRRRGGE